MHKAVQARNIASYLVHFICILFLALMFFIWTQLKLYSDYEINQSYSSRIEQSHMQAMGKLNSIFSLLQVQKSLMDSTELMTQATWGNFFSIYFESNPQPEVYSLEYIRLLKTSLPITYIYSSKTPIRRLGFDYENVPYLREKLRAAAIENTMSVIRLPNISSKDSNVADILLVMPQIAKPGNSAGLFVVSISSIDLYKRLFSVDTPNLFLKVEVLAANSQGMYKKLYEYFPATSFSSKNISPNAALSEYNVVFANELLQFRYLYDPLVAQSISSRFMPSIILLFGIILVFLMYAVYRTFESTRAKSLRAVQHATSELRKFKLALDGVNDHVIITDPEGIILYANPTVESITGFSYTDIVGKKAGDANLWGGHMSKEFYKKLWNTIKVDKMTFSGEVKNKRRNGELYNAHVKISPILNKRHEVVYFVGIERDITEEKMQNIIKGQLDTFFGISQELLCISTTQGYFVKLSNSFQNTLGWPIEELLNKPYLSLVHASDLFAVKESMHKLSSGEVATNFRCRIMCKDGSYKEFHWHVVTDFNGYLYSIAHETA